MGSDNNLSSNCELGEMEEKKGQKISVSDHVSDSFVVDMDRFSQLMEKDISSSSRISLQRNLSRKGSMRNGEMKIIGNDGDTASMLLTSPRATLHGGSSTPEKPGVVAVVPTDHSHHQITISNGSANGGLLATNSKGFARKLSFRRTPQTWTSDPKRILVFFATLSSMGTILLIYFTLSIGKIQQ